jgi:hypothetical protein
MAFFIVTTMKTSNLDSHLNSKIHVNQLVQNLSRESYAVRSLSHISNFDTMKLIYFAYFHSLMKYRIIFWGNSCDCKKVFTLQKKTVKIIEGRKAQTPCRALFKKLQILPLPCEYIFSLLNFVINNLENFQTSSAIHNVNTRNKHHLHRPTANLTCFQKSAYYPGIKIFNNLPATLKSPINEKAKFNNT